MNRKLVWGNAARLAALGVFLSMCARIPAQAPAAAPAAPAAAPAAQDPAAAPPATQAAPDAAAPAAASAAPAASAEKTLDAYSGDMRRLLAQKKYDELLKLIAEVEVKFPGDETSKFYRSRAEEEQKSYLNRSVPRMNYDAAARAQQQGGAKPEGAPAAPVAAAAPKPVDISPLPKAAVMSGPDVKARKGAGKPVFLIVGAMIVAGMVFLSVVLMWRKRSARGSRDESTQTDFGYETTDGAYGEDVAIQPPGYAPMSGGGGLANGMAGDFSADPLAASADPFGGFGTPQGGFGGDPGFGAPAAAAEFDVFGGSSPSGRTATATATRGYGEPEPVLGETAEDIFAVASTAPPKKSPAPIAPAPLADEPFALFDAFDAPSTPAPSAPTPAPAPAPATHDFDPLAFSFDEPAPAAAPTPSLMDDDLPTIALSGGPASSSFSAPPVQAPAFSMSPPPVAPPMGGSMGGPPISSPTFSSAPPSRPTAAAGSDAPFVSPFGGSKQPENDETMMNFDAFMNSGPGSAFPPAPAGLDFPMLSSMPAGDETMISPVGGHPGSEPMNLDSTVVLSAGELMLDPDLMVQKKGFGADSVGIVADAPGGAGLDLTGGNGGDAFEHQKSLGLQAIRDAQWDAAVKHLALAASLRPEAMDVKEQLRRARRMRKTE